MVRLMTWQSNNLATHDLTLGTDESCVLQYVQHFPESFLTEMEIARKADGRGKFEQDNHWAHVPLSQLVDFGMLETDGKGRYRLKVIRKLVKPSKFISPSLRHILERSSHNFDLSMYH